MLILLFHEVGVIQENKPLPIPIVDMIDTQQKKAVQIVQESMHYLLVTAGIGAGTGVAGVTISMIQYNKFTSKLDTSFQKMFETMLTIQKQINCLAAVVP